MDSDFQRQYEHLKEWSRLKLDQKDIGQDVKSLAEIIKEVTKRVDEHLLEALRDISGTHVIMGKSPYQAASDALYQWRRP